MRSYRAIIIRDVTLAFRAGGSGFQAVAFFALIILLFALAIGPDTNLMTRISGPILWTGALLATLISLDQIYRADREDGSLDVIIEATDFLAGVAIAKALAHWLTTALPLILMTPILGILLNVESGTIGPIIVSLLIGTPGLSLLGAFAAALSVSLPRASVLMSIIISPFYVPFLIFGAGAVSASVEAGPQYSANLLLLGASSLFALVISPLASAAALRFNQE